MGGRAPERKSQPGVSCRIRHTATVAGVSLPADSFVSGTTLSAASVVSVACEPTVASADPVEVPLLGVRAAARGEFEEALSTDAAVARTICWRRWTRNGSTASSGRRRYG